MKNRDLVVVSYSSFEVLGNFTGENAFNDAKKFICTLNTRYCSYCICECYNNIYDVEKPIFITD